MIHHVAIDTDYDRLAREVEFWNLLGFAETSPARRGSRSARWLVSPEAGCAVELHVLTEIRLGRLVGHFGLVVSDFGDRTAALEAWGHQIEPVASYFGYKRAYATSPSGHTVELLEGAPSIRAGRPMEVS